MPIGMVEAEAFQPGATLAQGQPQQGLHGARAVTQRQHVEADVDDRHVRQDLRRRPLPAEPTLQRLERQRATIPPGQDLAVEDAVPGLCWRPPRGPPGTGR